MITSDELQKLSEEAEARAKETRRSNYIDEHVRKPAILSNRYDWIFTDCLYPAVLVGGCCLAGYAILTNQSDLLLIILIITWYVRLGLHKGVAWQRDGRQAWKQARYQKKVRKAEAKFDELVRKENLQFHVTDWEYYKNS